MATVPTSGSTMQQHTTADGQEDEMSAVSYPPWSASTSHEHHAGPSAEDKYNHWWPSQAYHCTFCPRVFRTAQALGGHMNIHRRERAFANDAGTHFHTRPGDSDAATSILSRSSSHPAATLGQHRNHVFNSTPPAPAPCPANCKENCYANRRNAVAPHSATHPVSTANLFAPLQVEDMPYHRVGRNGGDGAKSEKSSGQSIADPLSWLFSQLPPAGSASTLQRQLPEQQHNLRQQQQCRGGNVPMQKNLAKPYDRAVAVRRSVAHPWASFSEQCPQAGGRSDARASRTGQQEYGEEDLDLELRL